VAVTRLGLLSPLHELPGEVQDVAAAARPPVALWQVITASSDDHSLPALRATADTAALTAGARRLARWRPDAVAWACTSGSFVVGRAGALDQLAAIEAAAAAPATSTSLAFVEALDALGIDEVVAVAPYPEPAAAAFAAFLGEWGIAVSATVPLGCTGPSASERLDAAAVAAALERVGDGVPVLLADTAVWGIEIHAELAPRLAAPLLVANQVTLWHALGLAGADTDIAALGVLAGVPAGYRTRPGRKAGGAVR